MFRASRWVTCGLLGAAIYALVLKLASVSTTGDETTVLQKAAEQRADAASSPYTQHREGMRRDLYQGSGATRRHVVYTAGQADMVWQKQLGEFKEYLTQVGGVFDEEEGQLRIKSPAAVCLSHPMTLTLEAVDVLRLQKTRESLLTAKKAVWKMPEEEHQPWILEAEGAHALSRSGHPMSLDLSCDRSTYSNKVLSCIGHVQLQMPPFKMYGERLCWQEIPQLLSLEGSRARVEYTSPASNDSSLEAQSILLTLDAEKRPVHLDAKQQVEGDLSLKCEKGTGRLAVKSDRLTWDGTNHHMILEGHICLKLYQEGHDEPLCTLTAEQQLTCACVLTPHLSCHKIQVEGPMQLDHATWGLLTCSGLTLMDCFKNKVIARGLQGSNGQVPLENQVSLETAQGKIQADRFALDLYREDVQGFSLHAQGLVGIEGMQGQYALGHEMHYDTRTHKGQLLGTHSQRVLFWEPRYDVKLSAPSCLFTLRDPVTGKIQVQGKGDVRMSFFDMERKKIQTRFPSYERHKT